MRKKYSLYFKFKEDRVFCADDCPGELKDLIRQIHFDCFYKCMPCDWIYKTIYEAFCELEEDKLEDINIEPDIYHNDLLEWMKSIYANEYVEEYKQEFEGKGDIYKLISGGQWLAKDRIYRYVNDFIEESKQGEE